jgi:phytoene synthase
MATPSFVDHEQQRMDLALCRRLLEGGSRSFHAASHLLPRRMRAAATVLYAFCRLADDAIDQPQAGVAAALDGLRTQLDRIYAGRPQPTPMERLFVRVVHDYAIPRAVLEALLQGFEWDARGRQYDSLSDLNAYAVRVAGTVGILMTLLMGVRQPVVLARACDLGVAMQLTNIARDVGQDARLGRLYLPTQWLELAGIDPVLWLRQPKYSPELGCVIERLLWAADELYARARPAVARLPVSCRAGIHAARLLYAEIGHELRRMGLDSVSQRARVGAKRKGVLLFAALASSAAGAPDLAYAPLEQARFLLDAVDAARTHAHPQPRRPSNAEWLIDLFVRLGQRDQRAALEEVPLQ